MSSHFKGHFGGEFKWSLLGIPDHAGVLNVGGRIGAAKGPEAFRKVLSRMKGRAPVQQSLCDLGDVEDLGAAVEVNHLRASERVRAATEASPISVVVGGGHDHGFSHLRGISEAFPGKNIGCINIDAHLDVRKAQPVITSGSPFYLALEAGILKPQHFVEFGIQSHCNAADLWKYVESKSIEVVEFEHVRGWKSVMAFKAALNRLCQECDLVVISLDLDAAASAYAPGVSAPQAEGFTSSEIIEMVEVAGAEKKVLSLGIFELNPVFDLDDRTARLATTAAWHFVEKRILAESGFDAKASKVGARPGATSASRAKPS